MSNGLRQLLALQAQDTLIDQLQHRRDVLQQRTALSNCMKEIVELKKALDAASADRDATASQQLAIEKEVESIEQRSKSINARLFGSSPVNPKDAQAMTEEVAHLDQKKSELEDKELEQMEALEPKQEKVAELEGVARDLSARIEIAKRELGVAEVEIDQQLEAEKTKRSELAADIDAKFMATYEKLRPKLAGVAIAALDGDKCGGCHLTLSSAERERVRSASEDEIVNCEECGRILIPA